jgi:HD-GYP domain-containing protein (c-di-GMP phosphodiesterase class II)
MHASPAPARIRLAELVALLSLGTDLGFGQPMEHAIRQCLIALKLSEALEMTESERVVLYYSGLLAWVGCHTDAYEQAKWFGDDIRLKTDMAFNFDQAKRGAMASLLVKYLGGAGRPLASRVRVGVAFFGQGWRDLNSIAENHYLATDELAVQLGLGEDVRASLRESYERWDGTGWMGSRGEELMLASRLVNLADVVEVFQRTSGTPAAVAVARERSGTQFDPSLVDLFCAEADRVFATLPADSTWDTVIAAEPALGRTLTNDEFDAALEAIADFTDLKSPWTLGHSRAVATLAADAARDYGLPPTEAATLSRAALVHDIGRLGVSNAIWDKRGPLSQPEMERVRLHPYLTERMLSFSPALAPLGAIAVQHHERLDGSGYPRGLPAAAITPQGRILAAADAYRTMIEMRPHRPARTPDDAALQLRSEVAAGRIDGDAANAILRAAGHTVNRRHEWPAGLTAREVEVLKLLVRGLSNKEIAERLVISRKTAGNHVEHIYGKIGVSNRARASLFAVKHGIMSEPLSFDVI